MGKRWDLLIQTVLDENEIALFNDGHCVSSISHQADFKSDNTFVQDICRCLSDQQVPKNEIHSLTILQGPGYFTGIRAGIVIAKAWMDSFSIPVRLMNSFKYVRGCFSAPEKTAILIRASKTEGYAGFFRKSQLVSQECIKLESVPSYGQEWKWFTPSVAFKSLSGIQYVSPSLYLPQQYEEVTRSEQIAPHYGRSLEELFQPL